MFFSFCLLWSKSQFYSKNTNEALRELQLCYLHTSTSNQRNNLLYFLQTKLLNNNVAIKEIQSCVLIKYICWKANFVKPTNISLLLVECRDQESWESVN